MGRDNLNLMDRHYHADMLSVEEALGTILSAFQPLEKEEKPLLSCLGQVLAEDIYSSIDIPPLNNSAMDGYALRSTDLIGAAHEKPVFLKVVGVVAAGEVCKAEVEPGTTVRIMTGAAIPQMCDTVVPFEETDELERKDKGQDLNIIGIKIEQLSGMHIRLAGEDVHNGDLVLRKGLVLRPAEMGVLASLGMNTVNVIRRPNVAILATGDELLLPEEDMKPGKIYDSNSYSLAAAVLKYGGNPILLGIAHDNLQDLHDKLDQGLNSDLIITSAGVSKGDYDVVKDALSERGKMNFWSVRMRPAKPLAWGILEGLKGRLVPHLGLPGNPVSALVAFEEFARPAILKMLGRTKLSKPTIKAKLKAAIINPDGRRVLARVVVTKVNGVYFAEPTGPQGSNIMMSLVHANGLAICPEDKDKMDVGQTVSVKMLDWNEEIEV